MMTTTTVMHSSATWRVASGNYTIPIQMHNLRTQQHCSLFGNNSFYFGVCDAMRCRHFSFCFVSRSNESIRVTKSNGSFTVHRWRTKQRIGQWGKTLGACMDGYSFSLPLRKTIKIGAANQVSRKSGWQKVEFCIRCGTVAYGSIEGRGIRSKTILLHNRIWFTLQHRRAHSIRAQYKDNK